MKQVEASFIIPAYNEESYLPHTLQVLKNALEKVNVAHEIIVVDNNSTDRTAEVARSEGARVVFEKVNQISRARNAGAFQAKGSFLFFIDADTEITEPLISTALQKLRHGNCVGGGVLLQFDQTDKPGSQIIINTWNLISRWLHYAAGCFIFCTKEGFEHIEGFNEDVYASEEIWLVRKLKKWGKRRHLYFQVLDDIKIKTSARKFDWYPAWKMFGQLLILFCFPFAVRSKKFCSFWYQRPNQS